MSIVDLDRNEIIWQDLGSCAGMVTESENQIEIFFDDYESDPFIAESTDQMCMSCPVAKQCGLAGVRGKEWGVWGGVYLRDGKIDKTRNAHKSDADWDRLKGIHSWL